MTGTNLWRDNANGVGTRVRVQLYEEQTWAELQKVTESEVRNPQSRHICLASLPPYKEKFAFLSYLHSNRER